MESSVIDLALSAGSDADFELFGQTALQIVLGMEFEPTGGMHDGGQDGFLRPVRGKPERYVQISTQETYKTKITDTIKRLRAGNRTVASLAYVTPLHIAERDIIEAEIEKSTGVVVRIHDQRWLVVQMAVYPELETAFKDRYSSVLRSLQSVTDHSQQRYQTTERMSVLVYLENHEKSEPEKSDLFPLAIDAAIFMALKDTDPEKGQFLTEAQIITFVEKFFPQVKTKAGLLVPERLGHLRTKKGNPRIRFHNSADYALPYEVRSEFSTQNALLKQVDADFWISIRARAKAIDPDLTVAQQAMIEDAITFSITKTFEQQGLNLMAMNEGVDSFEEIRTYDYIRESLSAATTDGAVRRKLEETVATILRRIFYSGTEAERKYLFRLFKLYSVDFIIRGDEKVWNYFRNVVRKLRLVVGTDVFVRALSEACVNPQNQATQNVLRILKTLGGKLILSEHVLQEVYSHIRVADREFEAFYKPWAQHVTLDEAKQSSKILIRAFFYSRLEPEGHSRSPASWDDFLNMFGSANWFREEGGERNFAAYLQNKFGLTFISRADVDEVVSGAIAQDLARKLLDAKHGNFDLALNDAYMMLFVQEARKQSGETFGSDAHGFATWWLTEEFHAVEIARAYGLKDRLKMHPQFLMNYIAAVPGMRDVAEKHANSFPTVFGLRITHRVGDDVLKVFLKSVVDAVKSDEAAAHARIRDLSIRLMAKRP